MLLPELAGKRYMSDVNKHIHIVYDAPGWAYYHRARALQQNAPRGYEVSIGNSIPSDAQLRRMDLVFVLCTHGARQFRVRILAKAPHVVLVVGVNTGFSSGLNILRLHDICDAVIYNNWGMYRRFGARPGSYQISNGVDLRTFQPTIPLDQRPRRALWLGSMFHRELKGYSIVSALRDDLESAGVELDLRLVDSTGPGLATPAEMRDWYNSGILYLVTSRCEGTPNPALEAAACGCVLVATPVGNMPELIRHQWNGVLLRERSPKTILEGVRYACAHLEHLNTNMESVIRQWSWQERAARYFDLFERLIRRDPPGPEWNVSPPFVESVLT